MNRLLGGSWLDGFVDTTDLSLIFIKSGKLLTSINNGNLEFWRVEDEILLGGIELASGNFANPLGLISTEGGTLRASKVILDNGDTVQESLDQAQVTTEELIDYITLKIFQSPTDGGLTEIQTRTANGGEVYEVRKTSDDSLATIYSDADGTIEITQNGTNNVSDGDGVVEFFVADGAYYVEVNSEKSYVKSRSISNNYINYEELIDNSTGYAADGLKVSTGTSVWLVNSKIGFAISNTLPQLYVKSLNGVFLSDFTGASDGTSDKQQLMQKAFDLSEGGSLNVDSGVFYIESDNVDVRSNTKVNGLGGTIKLGGHSAVLRVWDVENVVIDGLNIDGNLLAWTNFGQYTLPIEGSENITVKNCHIYNGQNAGIGVGQQLKPDYNKNVKILYNHIHNIGMDNHPNFTSYGNGVAVTGGEDILIEGNTIHDIHQVGCINIEGTFGKNIQVISNICHTTTGRAAGIKCYSGGVDVPADNLLIKDNTIYNIGKLGDPDAENTEPSLWVEAGDGVTVENNTIRDCPPVGKAGVLEVTSGSLKTRVINNKIIGCDGGRIFISGALDLTCTGNEVECTDTTTLIDNNLVPFYVETNSSGEGAVFVNNNLVKDAPYTSYIFNPVSSGDFTGNRVVRPNRVGGSYTIRSLTGFKFSRQGGNTIVHDGNENIGVATYNFSGGGHQDMEVLADIWKAPDLSLVTKYDTGSNNYYIESSFAIKAGSNPAPTLGYNPRGRSIKTANPQSGKAAELFCTVAGTPGTWVGVPLP